MNVVKQFRKNFGIKSNASDEKRKFVSRIEQTIFRAIQEIDSPFKYETIFRRVCYQLGINADDLIAKANQMNLYNQVVPDLRNLSNGDFLDTMEVTCLIHSYFSETSERYGSHATDKQNFIDSCIESALVESLEDIGIRWHKGLFYKSGAPELDQALIDQSLEWLSGFPAEKIDMKNAITSYSSKNYQNMISEGYNSIEGISRSMLENQKTLDKNITLLKEKYKLSPQQKNLLSNIYHWSNDYRHASNKRHKMGEVEAESFLYSCGLAARMLTRYAR